MMNQKEMIFLILFIVNFIIALIYRIWGAHVSSRNGDGETTERDKVHYRICFWIMVLCPGVGVAFLGVARLLYTLVFRNTADLEDVIFGKDKIAPYSRADVEVERNMVPMEEAIAISDRDSLRTLMLNVLKGDIQKSLSAIYMALNSEDTETSHYAASFLRDELNDFRVNVQKVYTQILEDEGDREEYCCLLIEYMNDVLSQKVFTPMEQRSYVGIMEEVLHTLFQTNHGRITSQYYEWVCLRLLEIKNYAQCEYWCRVAMDEFPEALSAYTCMLKLYFTTQDRKKFFKVMEQLKKSQITIDRETLELIRIFS